MKGLISLLFILSMVLSMTIYGQTKDNKKYEVLWKKVEAMEKKALPKSALLIVHEIYGMANKEKNSAQIVKAVIFKLKYSSFIEEGDFLKTIPELDQEAKMASFPEKQVLYSLLGELYWSYYENNRYRFLNRSIVEDTLQTGLQYWDLDKIISKVVENYSISLLESDKLKKVAVSEFYPIIIKGEKPSNLRPTLYDFLAHRAIDFLFQNEPNLKNYDHALALPDSILFHTSEIFATFKINNTASGNFKMAGLKILQQLTLFRLKENNKDALADLEIRRMEMAYKHLSPGADNLYLNALELLLKKYTSDPLASRIIYLKAKYYFEQSEKYDAVTFPEYRYSARVAYNLCNNVIEKYNNTEGAAECKVLLNAITSKDIDLSIENFNLPDSSIKFSVAYKNISKLYFKVVNTNIEEYNIVTDIDRENKTPYEERVLEKYKNKKSIEKFSIILPDGGDFKTHRLEAKISSLKTGYYIILASTDSLFSANRNVIGVAATCVSNISFINKENNNKGQIEFFLLHRKTGLPLANANVQVLLKKFDASKKSWDFTREQKILSDARGYFKIDKISGEDRSFDLEITHEQEKIILNPVSIANPYYNEKFYLPYPSNNNFTHTRTFFFLDRKIFRPGQIVYFKGLVLRVNQEENSTLLKKQNIEVSLFDANNQKINSLSLVTNEFGTYNGSFVLPATRLTGSFRIEDGHGTEYFSVEAYKRPKFEVKLDKLKEPYTTGDSISLAGTAKSYAGINIQNSIVKYRVERTGNIRFPFHTYGRNKIYPPSPPVTIISDSTLTDLNGNFSIKFVATPPLHEKNADNKTFNYIVYADVTDINGETQSTQRTFTIGNSPISIDATFPEVIFKESGENLEISSKDLNGDTIATALQIKIFKLKSPERSLRKRLFEIPDTSLYTKEEYLKYFPNDYYDEHENPAEWAKEKLVLKENINTGGLKNLKINGEKWEEGKYQITITYQNTNKDSTVSNLFFTLTDQKSSKMPFKTPEFFAPVTLIAEPGQNASILIGSSEPVFILYEIEKDNVTLLQNWVSLNNEKKIISIPVTEEHRGNFTIHYAYIYNNRLYSGEHTFNIPFSNKKLDLSFETFRNKTLPGSKEEWKIKIQDKKGGKVNAELVGTLYDASLDQFNTNNFSVDIYQNSYPTPGWNSKGGFLTSRFMIFHKNWNEILNIAPKNYSSLNMFGLLEQNQAIEVAVGYGGPLKKGNNAMMRTPRYRQDSDLQISAQSIEMNESSDTAPSLEKNSNSVTTVVPRSNFNETAFFYPALLTNNDGIVEVKFTIPEALTRWKFLSFAHTQDLKNGSLSDEIITQKDLMVTPLLPRFLREKDTIVIKAKIDNLTDKEMNAVAEMNISEAITSKSFDDNFQNKRKQTTVKLPAKGTAVVSWSIIVPEGIDLAKIKIIAKAGGNSDGEESTVPVLKNKIFITESIPLHVKGGETKTFTLKKLINNPSSTLKTYGLTIDFTSNPAWYALQALPYLKDNPHDGAEQIFSKLYATLIAKHISNSNPKIQTIFQQWNNSSSESLTSDLEKNQELKNLLLAETPWLVEGRNETDQKKRISLLFDINQMTYFKTEIINKLYELQNPTGAWPWFKGMSDNRYITQYIISGFGHLKQLGVLSSSENEKIHEIVVKALQYLDNEISSEYQRLKDSAKKEGAKLEEDHLNHLNVQYLYLRSFFKDHQLINPEAISYYKEQAQKFWTSQTRYGQACIALALHRAGIKTVPKEILASFKEHAIHDEEMGMYFKNQNEPFWYHAPIENQALNIEAFLEINGDVKSADEMKIWLLKQKQTQNWPSTKATAEAIYALLLQGTPLLDTEDQAQITIGGKSITDVKKEEGTGYFKKSWEGNEITPSMGEIKISKKSGIGWGGLYWQYFEDIDKITNHTTGLSIKKNILKAQYSNGKQIFKEINSAPVVIGDLLKIRIEIATNRDMEYIHLKDYRGAGLEPVNVISQYKYQDGLGYYESTKDLATHFFIQYLPKGNYVFEYELRVSHDGKFSNGFSMIECLYAPEFSSHTEGRRIDVGK